MVEDPKIGVSVLMDGEFEGRELEGPLAALRESDEARAAWRVYHLISDALRGRSMLNRDCAGRVAERLALEPVLIGPLPSDVGARPRPGWYAPSALAASVAAMALVGWMVLAPQQSKPSAGGANSVAQAPVMLPAPVKAEPVRLPLTAATRDYLLAHQSFSPRNSLQGVAPFVRSVAAEAALDKP